MTFERRLARAERVLKMFLRRGRQYRNEFRARHGDTDEKIDILINCQIDTNEQLRRTDEQLKKTDEQLRRTDEQIKKTDEQIAALAAGQAKTEKTMERLAASQAKTEASLDRFINSLAKGRNGNSSD